mmetsp:Transcript_5059/g.14855  ORF Transcript_5059/g.14855 Transcript_5059/m.14855 type:complete len:237 (-) Transcript_5059:9-719(-)
MYSGGPDEVRGAQHLRGPLLVLLPRLARDQQRLLGLFVGRASRKALRQEALLPAVAQKNVGGLPGRGGLDGDRRVPHRAALREVALARVPRDEADARVARAARLRGGRRVRRPGDAAGRVRLLVQQRGADPAPRGLLRALRVRRRALRRLPRVRDQARVRDQGLRLAHPGPRRHHGPRRLRVHHGALRLRLPQDLHQGAGRLAAARHRRGAPAAGRATTAPRRARGMKRRFSCVSL